MEENPLRTSPASDTGKPTAEPVNAAEENSPDEVRMSSQERMRVAEHATWISAGLNLALTIAQLLVGWIAHSQSLIAHGLHSFSDLLSDFLVLFANRKGHEPADEDHPYGHQRYETAATLILGVSLLGVGTGVLWDVVGTLQSGAPLTPVGIIALWVALATVAAKEALYQYLIRVADRLRSRMLTANALHTRADAASALVVVAGVTGSLLGWPFLDLVAAVLMGGMILKLGGELAWGALTELIDTGLDAEEVAAIRKLLRETAGVRGVHELKTRRMAHRALVDAHLQVDARISVSEGHLIAESARARVLKAQPHVLDVLVHIDPENDADDPEAFPPSAAKARSAMEALCAGMPEPQRVVLHFLQRGVEAELFFAVEDSSAELLEGWREMLKQRVPTQKIVTCISLHTSHAPIQCGRRTITRQIGADEPSKRPA